MISDLGNFFVRLEGQASYHWKISNKNILAVNTVARIISATDNENLPIDLRYFIGGSDTIRSFPFREFTPESNGLPGGGQAFWYTNVEYLRKIAGPVYGLASVSYTHLRAHETEADLVCRLLLEKKK